MATLRKRLLSGAGVNLYGQIITILTQLASLPIFLSIWSVEEYGVWLLMTSIPAYILMSDCGFIAVAMNRVCVLVGAGKENDARSLYRAQIALTTIICLFVASVSAIIIFILDFKIGNSLDGGVALYLLILAALIHVYSGIFDTVFRACNIYTKGTFFLESSRLIEWVGAVAGVYCYKSYLGAAAGWLCGRTLAAIGMYIYILQKYSLYKPGFSKANWQEMWLLKKDAYAWMMMKVGDSLNIQGMSILVGNILGPAALTYFNAYRTMARCILQGTSALTHAFWPEFSRLAGESNTDALASFFRKSKLITFASALTLAAGLLLISKPLLFYWSHGKIEFSWHTMLLIVVYGVICAYWYTIRIYLMTQNRLFQMSNLYNVIAVTTVSISLLLSDQLTLNLIIIVILVAEAVSAIAASILSRVSNE
ncbi:hypothetical protein HA050_20610 [Iodobacter sp. HSC-16F04]|uniref:Polysaccharide biosynthesis protein n=1 Tax=Iodobacter violaceini TaxID=3044271 RepID=A0ABX0KUW4_9NEIS|nr:hypothetical protein [Iodobacter violacea]NHQ88505.1 hypothetical protein [Iodobacter violacea]